MDKLAIVFDGPPAHKSGRFVEVELNGKSVSFGDWQENGEFWELVLPEPYAKTAAIEAELANTQESLAKCQETHGKQYGMDWRNWGLATDALAQSRADNARLREALENVGVSLTSREEIEAALEANDETD